MPLLRFSWAILTPILRKKQYSKLPNSTHSSSEAARGNLSSKVEDEALCDFQETASIFSAEVVDSGTITRRMVAGYFPAE
jgi:hypothetical protein